MEKHTYCWNAVSACSGIAFVLSNTSEDLLESPSSCDQAALQSCVTELFAIILVCSISAVTAVAVE